MVYEHYFMVVKNIEYIRTEEKKIIIYTYIIYTPFYRFTWAAFMVTGNRWGMVQE